MTAKRRWFAFALVALMVGVASRSHAQDYPSRFIRVIVGPGPDITARVFGAKITEVLGQQVVVEPRPGAGGTIAAQAVAGAPGDGYTLLLASASYTINTAMGQSPLDLGRDFAPIALVATVPFVLVVHPSLAAKNLAELIDAGQGQARQAQLCVVGHRHAAAPRRRAVQVHGRHRRRACAVSRGERRAQRRRGRRGRDDVLDRLDRRLADRRRQGARHRASPRCPPRPSFPACRRWRKRGLPASRCWDGTDSWRPRERRRRSSGSSIRPCNAASTIGELRQRLVAAGYEPAARNSPDDFARFIHADTAKWVALVEQTKMKGQ